MNEVFANMAFYVGLGVLWRHWQPGGSHHETTRHAITALVYNLFLPLLVLRVLWGSHNDVASPWVPVVAAAGVGIGLVASFAVGKLARFPAPTRGAVILASSFPNVTYLGLPVLTATLGDAGASIALHYDLFACTPLLFTIGLAIAGMHGVTAEPMRWAALYRAPPLWAAAVALLLNGAGIDMPVVLQRGFDPLVNAVAPLMLVAVGMSLNWSVAALRLTLPLATVILLQLVLIPAAVLQFANGLGFTGTVRVGTVLEAAMPTMVIGLAICDRYRLDSAMYAAAITWTTVLSFLSLPVWLRLLQ